MAKSHGLRAAKHTGEGAEVRTADPEGWAGPPRPGGEGGGWGKSAWTSLVAAGPGVLPSLVEVGFQPDVARLLQ